MYLWRPWAGPAQTLHTVGAQFEHMHLVCAGVAGLEARRVVSAEWMLCVWPLLLLEGPVLHSPWRPPQPTFPALACVCLSSFFHPSHRHLSQTFALRCTGGEWGGYKAQTLP